ncbi:MAG: hypothetical protein ABSC60_04740 [Acidobacteriota bacterium]|jgi:hypothetical protein
MKETNDARFKSLLKQALRPISPELQRDLWPQMLRRIDERSPAKTVPWFDWALLAIVVISNLAFPHSILLLLYQL